MPDNIRRRKQKLQQQNSRWPTTGSTTSHGSGKPRHVNKKGDNDHPSSRLQTPSVQDIPSQYDDKRKSPACQDFDHPDASLGSKSKFAALENLQEDGDVRKVLEDLKQKLKNIPGPSGKGGSAHLSRKTPTQPPHKAPRGPLPPSTRTAGSQRPFGQVPAHCETSYWKQPEGASAPRDSNRWP